MPVEINARNIAGLLKSKIGLQREQGVKLLAQVAKVESLRKRADIAELLKIVNGKAAELKGGKMIAVKYSPAEAELRTALSKTLTSVRSEVSGDVRNALQFAQQRFDAEQRQNDAAKIT